MQIDIFNYIGDKRVTDKTGDLVTSLEGSFKEEADISSPSITICYNADILQKGNYCFIPALFRYYFIESIVIKPGNMMTLNCKVDLLNTLKDDIRKLVGMVRRQEHVYSDYIVDEKKISLTKRSINKYAIGSFTGASIVLTTTGGASS